MKLIVENIEREVSSITFKELEDISNMTMKSPQEVRIFVEGDKYEVGEFMEMLSNELQDYIDFLRTYPQEQGKIPIYPSEPLKTEVYSEEYDVRKTNVYMPTVGMITVMENYDDTKQALKRKFKLQ